MVITFAFLDRAQVYAFEQHVQIGPTQRVLNSIPPMMAKCTLLQSFAPDAITTAVKIEYLCLGAPAVDEHKQLAAKWIFLKLALDQR
ncbi:hypothetical protein GZ78_28825 [Endozoicomonas numazuensis]|uniref:Uncharacterized protein n=1 Tax=Endozoicomonas numazuensis TaxID=1137799 RepID=A0A081MZC0_9GAMM|nr:hypothetical protein GZ78_28825 [Endozoicomonas numazuensis]